MLGSRLGPYLITAELGSGGMGTVYRATGADGAVVAIKVVHPHLLDAEDFRERFDREAQVGLAIRHPNVVATLACLEVQSGGRSVPALVLEYVEGRSLTELLEELHRVPEDLCRHLARETARGLEAIHAAGIVHRDVKPGNVLITTGHEVKVMDLGLARRVSGEDRLSSTGVFIGTAAYAPPEQFRGEGQLDPRSDLWSLGAVLYELSTGELPFRAKSLGELVRKVLDEKPARPGLLAPQLSAFFEALLLQLLEKDPANRFASARELGGVLDAGERSPWWAGLGVRSKGAHRLAPRRIRSSPQTELWGRERELGVLVEAWEAAKGGDGRVVLLEGETGIGKSRLADELLARVEAEDAHVVVGGYPPGGAATANGAFAAAYREHFGAEGLAEALKPHLKETPLLVPAFAALLRGDLPPPGAEPLTKDSLQTCFVLATRSLAAEKPLIVVIDDLQFAPQEGRSLFAALAHAVPGHRVLLVGLARPGLPAPWIAELERRAHVSRREIRRLDEATLRAQLTTMLGRSLAAEDLAGRISARAEGNPFFVFEILRALREGGHLSQAEDGAWSVAAGAHVVDIPASVRDLVAARLSALAEADRELLEVAACHGHEFDGRLVAQVLGRPRLDVLRRLGRIERERALVRATGASFSFDHHAVQEVLYEAMPRPLREELHGGIGAELERMSGAATQDAKSLQSALAVEICGQFLRSTQVARARRYIEPALAYLEQGYLNDAAVSLGERGLALPGVLQGAERARVLLRLADGPLDRLGRRARQEEAAREAEQIAEQAGEQILRGQAARAVGIVCWRTSRIAEAEAALRRSRELARACGDRKGEAVATGNLGNAAYSQGFLEQAREHYERGLAIHRELHDRHGESIAMGNLGNVLHAQGRLAEAQEHHERKLAVDLEIGNRQGQAIATCCLGMVLRSDGRLAAARLHFERYLAMSREIGDRQGEALATGNLGMLLHSQGRLGEARAHHERALALSREIGFRQGEAAAAGCLGDALFAQGRLGQAREQYERQLGLSREIGDRRSEGVALQNLGRVLRAQGDTAGAEARLLACLDLSRETGDPYISAGADLELGAVCVEKGDSAGARERLSAARDRAAGISAPGLETIARCRLACLPGGDASDAVAGFVANRERLDPAEHLSARWFLWKATGDRAHLTEAKRLLEEAVAGVEDDVRDSMLTGLPLPRDIAAAAREAGL